MHVQIRVAVPEGLDAESFFNLIMQAINPVVAAAEDRVNADIAVSAYVVDNMGNCVV